MNFIIAVVIAVLANGDMNYAAADANSAEDCKARVADIAHQRLAQNANEEVKVLGFLFKCVEFDNPFPAPAPSESPPPAPKHAPGKDEAQMCHPRYTPDAEPERPCRRFCVPLPPSLAAVEAARSLARLMERQLGYVEGHIDPVALRLFLHAHWNKVSSCAHTIHAEREP